MNTMRVIKKYVAMLLCVCIITPYILPCTSVKADEVIKASSNLIMETIDQTPVKANPEKKAETYATVDTGTTVTVLDITENAYGNIWYKVRLSDTEAYIYEAHLIPHECNYMIDYSTEDYCIKLCKCGAVQTANFSDIQMTALPELALAGGVTLATPGIREAVLLGTVLLGSYYLLNTIVYFEINSVGNLEVISFDRAKEIEDNYNDSKEIYYPAILFKDIDALVIVYTEDLNMKEAAGILLGVSDDLLSYKDIIENVYTYDLDDAKNLANYMVKTYPWKFQGYGNSKGFPISEIDHSNGTARLGHYNHYHLFSWNGKSLKEQKVRTHIFFGTPSIEVTESI